MKKAFIITLFIVSWGCVHTPNSIKNIEWDENLSTEQNIAKYATGFSDMHELQFLDKITAGRSVIVLGEEGHYDLTTSEVKINMIHYLQKKGFNSLGFEGLPLLTGYLFSNPDYSHINKDIKVQDFFDPWWTYYDIYNPLLELINNRKIKIWGIETVPGKYDILALQSILNKNNYNNSDLSLNWERLQTLFENKFLYYGHLNPPTHLSIAEEYELMDMINEVNNYVLYLISKKGSTQDLKVILQWIRNLNTAFSLVEYNGITNVAELALPFRNRDSQMAENIIWITENYPKEKLIICCANFHAAKDISQTTHPADSLLYLTMQCMGEGVYNQLKDKAYMLAFTSLNRMSNSGKFEACIAESIDDQPFGFVDFEPLRFQAGFRNQTFESSNMMKKEGKWLYIFDGMYYIRDQEEMQYVLDYIKSQENLKHLVEENE
ncbi:MAG: hypothetical protein LUH10_15455 [Tannerellaceae bacterium]|nr:hypothetical protein [Tannerellaceae bacterium]